MQTVRIVFFPVIGMFLLSLSCGSNSSLTKQNGDGKAEVRPVGDGKANGVDDSPESGEIVNIETPPPSARPEVSYSKEMVVKGVLEADPTPGGKAFQGTWIRVASGRRYVLSYRPMPKYYHLLWKKVRVTGRHKNMSQMYQQISADHFTADKIEAQGGQEIASEPPALMPEPPRVRSLDAVAKSLDRMVTIEATVASIQPAKTEKKSVIMIRFADGTTVQVGPTEHQMWTGFENKAVAFLTWVPKDFGPSGTNRLYGAYKVCPAKTKRCGMYTMAERRKNRKKRKARPNLP